MQLQLATQIQCLSLCQRHGVVQLEDVVGGFILVVRESVCQIDDVRVCSEIVCHLCCGRAVVELVCKSQRLGVLFIEETLIV